LRSVEQTMADSDNTSHNYYSTDDDGDDGTSMAGDYTVILRGGRPWGLRLQGGFEYGLQIRIGKVKLNGKAAQHGIQPGDLVNSINGLRTDRLTLVEALKLLYEVDSDSIVLQLTKTNRTSRPTAIAVQHPTTIRTTTQQQLQTSTACSRSRIVLRSRSQPPPESVTMNFDNPEMLSSGEGTRLHQPANGYVYHGGTNCLDSCSSRPPPATAGTYMPSPACISTAFWSPQVQRRGTKTYHPIRFDLTNPSAVTNWQQSTASAVDPGSATRPLSTLNSMRQNEFPQQQQQQLLASYWPTVSARYPASTSDRSGCPGGSGGRRRRKSGPAGAQQLHHGDDTYVRTLHPSQLPVDCIRGSSLPISCRRDESLSPSPPPLPALLQLSTTSSSAAAGRRKLTLEEFVRQFGPCHPQRQQLPTAAVGVQPSSCPSRRRLFGAAASVGAVSGGVGNASGRCMTLGKLPENLTVPAAAMSAGHGFHSLPHPAGCRRSDVGDVASALDRTVFSPPPLPPQGPGAVAGALNVQNPNSQPCVAASRLPSAEVTTSSSSSSITGVDPARPRTSSTEQDIGVESRDHSAVRSSATLKLSSTPLHADIVSSAAGPQRTINYKSTRNVTDTTSNSPEPSPVDQPGHVRSTNLIPGFQLQQQLLNTTAIVPSTAETVTCDGRFDEESSQAVEQEIKTEQQRRLPAFENPLVTLLHCNRSDADRLHDPVRATTFSDSSTPGSQSTSAVRTSKADYHGKEVGDKNDEEAGPVIPSVPKKDETTYKDWYRKVFSALHKQTKESDYTIYDAIANDKDNVIPDRPSGSCSAPTPVPNGGKILIKSIESKKKENVGISKTHPKEDSAKEKSSPQTAQMKPPAKNAKNTVLIPSETDDDDELLRAIQSIELDIDALAHRPTDYTTNNNQVRNQRSSPSLKKRSLQEPCQIVKPEDGSLFTDDYWLQLAEEWEQERKSQKFILPGEHPDIGNSHKLAKVDLLKSLKVGNQVKPDSLSVPAKLSKKLLTSPHSEMTNGDKSEIGKARAVFTFLTKNSRELTFNKGDTLTLLRQIDPNWYEGQLNGKVGLVPKNYVELLVPGLEDKLPHTANERTDQSCGVEALVLHDFTASSPHELSLNKGDIVSLVRCVDANWYEGHLPDGRHGIFPINYVEKLIDSGNHSPLTSPLINDFEIDCLLSPSGSSATSSQGRHGLPPRPAPPPPPPAAETCLDFDRMLDGRGLTLDAGSGFSDVSLADNQLSDNQLSGIGPASFVDSPKRVAFSDRADLRPERLADKGEGSCSSQSQWQQTTGGERQELFPLKKWYHVMYDYTPRHEDELELFEGDQVSIIRRYEDGWCVGMLDRTKAIGTFPGNYIL
jgi:hypothetical protein